ncbi:MAG: helix-turn-helix domain-containing protein [Gammaproteobacteria bacterium]
MDSLITAAARALAHGDVLGALKRVALRNDAPALALRGIAMARFADFGRAKTLLQRATRAFGPKEAVARARCAVALAEIALASRDLGWSTKSLDAARGVLETHQDHLNAAHARLLQIRRLVLVGKLDAAARELNRLDPLPLAPVLRATYELAAAGIAIRRVRTELAHAALARAKKAAQEAGIESLAAEIEAAAFGLKAPAARLISQGSEQPLTLAEVEKLLASDLVIVDACRHLVHHKHAVIALASKPVLFTLIRVLAEAWPADISRSVLITRAFRGRQADESYRARLRVEIGRLRRALRLVAGIHATQDGFALVPRRNKSFVVLAQPFEGNNAALLALLSDGESWSSSALGLALGASQRTIQRGLDLLAETGKVQSFGRGPARRWTAPALPGITTTLLLPVFSPGD